MQASELSQRTEDWYQARCGSLGASSIAEALATTKSGWGASRYNVMSRLIVERLTGAPQETYQNAAMLHGIEMEPKARATYEFTTGSVVEECGLFHHPEIKGTHASPDGLVGDDGLLEVKAPNTSTHIDTLLGKRIEGKYIKQAQWQLACTGRQWVDWVSYDDRLPSDLEFFCQRIERDDKTIKTLEEQVVEFLEELEGKLEALKRIRA